MTAVVARLATALALATSGGLWAGCAEPELKAAGQPCVASSECQPALVCDLRSTPTRCSTPGPTGR